MTDSASSSTIRSRRSRDKLKSTEEGRLQIKTRNRDHKRRQRRNIKINGLEERKKKYRSYLIPEVLARVDTKVCDHKQFLIRSLKHKLSTHDEKQLFTIDLLTFEIKMLAKKRQKKENCLPRAFVRIATPSIKEKAKALAMSSRAGKSKKANDPKSSDQKPSKPVKCLPRDFMQKDTDSTVKPNKGKAIGIAKFRRAGKSEKASDPKRSDPKSNEEANGAKGITMATPTVHEPRQDFSSLYWNPSMENQVDLSLNTAQYEEMALELLPNINADHDVLSLLDPVRNGLSLHPPVRY